MNGITKKDVVKSLAISAATAVVALIVFELIEKYHSLLGSLMVDAKPDSFLWQYLSAFFVAVISGGLTAKFGIRRIAPYLAGSLILLFAANIISARFFSLREFFVQSAATALLAAIFVHLNKLWSIDIDLTKKLSGMISTGHFLDGKSADLRIENGLKLLEIIFPLSEAIVFKYDPDENTLSPVGRARQENGRETALKRQSLWRENLQLCEEVLTDGQTRVQSEHNIDGGARVALPLIYEDLLVGVLFVKIQRNFEDADRFLLEAFSEQLARNFQRKILHGSAWLHTRLIGYFSTQSATNRVDTVTLLDNLMEEQSYCTMANSYLKEAHAIAFLDGSIAYLNRQMRHMADLKSAQISDLNIFGLLDNFKTEIFNEPSLAIRRVLQTGERYGCELFFPDTNKTLDLQISLVKVSRNDASIHETNVPMKPACLLITLNDISALKENAKLRSDMASLMSHELRTPLTSIKGFAELLLMDETIKADSREFLDIIANESDRLSKMLSTFLSVSNLEQSDKQEFVKTPVKLDHVVKEVVGEMGTSAKQKRIRLVEQSDINLPPVAADKGLITKVVHNLIDNAIKYSPEKTAVIISTIMEAEFLRVTVEDKGYGIAKAEQEKIWQKFYRIAREGHDKESESTGLGLAFAKEVATWGRDRGKFRARPGFQV